MLKYCFFIMVAFSLFGKVGLGQSFDLNVNIGTNTGERVVAVLNAGTIGPYTGVILVGEVVDNRGNWGQSMPTVSKFRLYVRFSGTLVGYIHQDVKTDNIILGLRQVAPNIVHVTAKCPVQHRNTRISLRKTDGQVTVTAGQPGVITTEGTEILNRPTYTSNLSGTLRIGDNSTAGLLEVNGNIRAKEVKVETANWPDYVFKPGYDLKPLTEVDSYIQQYGHLPGIPTAAEVEADGVDLGEMNRKLLEKVEELMLHAIKQEKQIEELSVYVQQLEKRSQEQHGLITDLVKKITNEN